ncbi:Mu-like-gpT domain-containing protein [Acetobacteraceae bacterium EV16G]|uniref:Mu-like-gpT domain-containing protein n=1 Tax=Sorlinia euscelidii TaxID=3081148 RepID=A0ABU7U0D3_9PROT
MEINIGNINALSTKLSMAFAQQLKTVEPTYTQFSLTVPSTSGENFYPRLAELPGLREWVGDRVIHRLKADAFRIRNKTFEETISISREDLEDEQFGLLMPAVQQLAQNAADLPDKLVYEALETGTSTKGMDGQYFFDTDHQTSAEDGSSVPYSNIGKPKSDEGEGPAWYLFCTTQPLKPLIFQPRRPFKVTPKTQLTDGNVFYGNHFIWGVDGRCAAGLGMYQFAYRSTRPLNGTSFEDALAAMASQRRRDGSPYGIRPDLMVVPNNLEGAARRLINGEFNPERAPDGTFIPSSNTWKGAAKLLVAPRLSQKVGG